MYEQSHQQVNDIMEAFAYFSINESCNLAIEKGSYKYFEGSDWSKGIFFGRKHSEMDSKNFDWTELYLKVKKYGMRNGGLFAVAPNTSTAYVIGSTASVLPPYRKYFIERNQDNNEIFFAPHLNDETFWYYKEHFNCDPLKVIEIIGIIQKWVDQGISYEPHYNNTDPKFKAKVMWDLMKKAHKLGIKTLYYTRMKTQDVTSDDSNCPSCVN
jgi:ribonucleoside-diphosphate reductase alpha chain